MENIKQSKSIKETLDLRKGWKQIKKSDVEGIINRKEKGKFWWFSDDKKRVSTLENGELNNYKANETDLLFIKDSEENPDVKQEVKSETLEILSLTPDNMVNNTAEAYERARYSDKTKFWFISKGKDKAVIVLDFSGGKRPKRTVYPLNKYNLKMKPVKI